jgi:hypothetical protein
MYSITLVSEEEEVSVLAYTLVETLYIWSLVFIRKKLDGPPGAPASPGASSRPGIGKPCQGPSFRRRAVLQAFRYDDPGMGVGRLYGQMKGLLGPPPILGPQEGLRETLEALVLRIIGMPGELQLTVS